MPNRIETGMRARSEKARLSPAARPVREVNRMMTNTSSTEAPAMIIWGIRRAPPQPSSMSRSILGTITAGETAATTLPRRAASRGRTPSSLGASSTIPTSSKQAGRKHISKAGRPTRLRSSRRRFKPARVRMMSRAIRRRSEERRRMRSSRRPRTCGPSKMPASSMPSRGAAGAGRTASPAPCRPERSVPDLVTYSSSLLAGYKKSQ